MASAEINGDKKALQLARDGDASIAEFKYFLSVPPEIRVMVYDLALDLPMKVISTPFKNKWVTAWNRRWLPRPRGFGLFLVNRQISREATHRLYSMATFHFEALALETESHPPESGIYYPNPILEWVAKIGRNALSVTRIEYRPLHPVGEEEGYASRIMKLRPQVPNLHSMRVVYNPMMFESWGAKEEHIRFIDHMRDTLDEHYEDVEDAALVADRCI